MTRELLFLSSLLVVNNANPLFGAADFYVIPLFVFPIIVLTHISYPNPHNYGAA